MFVALWRLSAIMTFVAYGVCRSIHDWFKQFRIRYLCVIRRSDEEEKPALPARRDTTSFNNFSFLCACAERIVLNIFILFYIYKWKLLRVNQFYTVCFATASHVSIYWFHLQSLFTVLWKSDWCCDRDRPRVKPPAQRKSRSKDRDKEGEYEKIKVGEWFTRKARIRISFFSWSRRQTSFKRCFFLKM